MDKPICPICGEECEDVYTHFHCGFGVFVGSFDEILGCENCVDEEDYDEPVRCPVCNAEVNSLYHGVNGIIGCRYCVDPQAASTVRDCFPDRTF